MIDRRERYPGLQIPFPRYDDGVHHSIGDLVAANIDHRPVYIMGVFKEDVWKSAYDLLPAGLATQVLPKGTAPPAAEAVRADLGRYIALARPPMRTPTPPGSRSTRALMPMPRSRRPFACRATPSRGDDDAIEALYRAVMRVDPGRPRPTRTSACCCSIAAAHSAEVVDLWRRYLELKPGRPRRRRRSAHRSPRYGHEAVIPVTPICNGSARPARSPSDVTGRRGPRYGGDPALRVGPPGPSGGGRMVHRAIGGPAGTVGYAASPGRAPQSGAHKPMPVPRPNEEPPRAARLGRVAVRLA